MKFESIKLYELKKEGITVLYPGSFKPITGAHIDFIKRYLKNPLVKEVILFISPGKRDNIKADLAYTIAQNVLSDLNVEVIIDNESPNPIMACYRWIEKKERQPGKYALASSNKGDDYKRVKTFVEKYKGEFKKNLPKGVQIVELPIDAEPLTYKNGEPISASEVRKAFNENDYKKFKQSYPNIEEKKIKYIWDNLGNPDQELEESGNIENTESTPSNYERIYPSQKYKSIKNVFEMGGAAGHVFNIWEVTDFTFDQLKDIVNKSLHGDLQNITEKLDGQNILITYKDEKALCARSTVHLKNYGELAMDIDATREYFRKREGNPESVEKAFVAAMEDFQDVFDGVDLDLDDMFKKGKLWLNIEILYTDNENIIPYDRNQLRIHHFRELDESGKTKRIIQNEKIDLLIEEIDRLQREGVVDNTFLIKKTNPLIIKYIEESNHIAKRLVGELDALQNSNMLLGTNTLADYIEEEAFKFINANLSLDDEEFKRNLAARWGRGDKSINIKTLLQDKDDETKEWVRKEEKNVKKLVENTIDPFVSIFSRLGVSVLKNLEGLVTLDQDKASKKIKDKLSRAIDHLKKFMNRNDVDDVESFNNKIREMVKHLERLENTGGLHSVVPVEGIVFEYDGKILKLTGSFTPLLRIIGFFRFG